MSPTYAKGCYSENGLQVESSDKFNVSNPFFFADTGSDMIHMTHD